VRYAARTLAAALVSAGATAAVALLSASRLADAPVRGRLPGPDPFSSLASLAGLAVGLVAFIWLGGSIAGDASAPRPALVAGAIGGALTGLAGALAQAVALSDYLGAVLTGYAVPSEFLTIALGAYVAIATLGAGAVGAAITYAGWHRARGRGASR
jgi:hypothetical protein